MKVLLNTLRWLIAIVLSLILSLIITLTPLILSLSTFVTHRENVLELIDATGIYDDLEGIIMNTMRNEVQETPIGDSVTNGEEIQLNSGETRDFITSIFTPKFVKDTVEQAIDGIYDYLDSKTPRPVIILDRKPIKDAYFNVLALAARRQMPGLPKNLDLSKLPQCKSDVKIMDKDNLCIPADINLEQQFEKIAENFNLGTNSDYVYIDLSKSGDVDFNLMREIYSIIKIMPAVLLVTIFILTLLIILLIPTPTMKFIFTAVVGIIPSLLNVILFSIPKIFKTNEVFKLETYISLEEVKDSELIIKTTDWLMNKLESNGLLFSFIVLAFYTLLLLIGIIINTRRKNRKEIETNNAPKTLLSEPVRGERPPVIPQPQHEKTGPISPK